MPELPEVLTIKKDLQKEIINKVIKDVEMVSYYPTKPEFSILKQQLVNRTVVQVENVAKLLTIHLDSQDILAVHLNMSGRLLYNTTDPYVKVKTTFTTGDKLHFSSVRMFETFRIMSETELEKYKKQYGKLIIDSTLTAQEFEEKMKKKNTYIKNNLLDQKLITGIGNIYATDALYLTKINPKTKSSKISSSQYKELLNNLILLINEGIEHRGSTIDRYTDIYGKAGSHQKHFRVYGKKNGKCLNCNSTIVFEKLSGRGTYYCKDCQRLSISKNKGKIEQNNLFT